MSQKWNGIEVVSHFVHERLIWFLVGSYALAAAYPAAGLSLRSISLGEVNFFGRVNATLPVIMLAALLINAGLGVQASQLKALARQPRTLLAGLAANLFIPIGFISAVTLAMRLWHNPDEVQNILVGLALVASMPIAGSSTAWSQNADGNMALSLGLVLASTLISPLTTPLALHAVGLMASGVYSEELHGLASRGTGAFLAIGVISPSLVGIGIRLIVGEKRIASAKASLKLINLAILLLLNYSNAAVSLPQAIAKPDLDFLAVTLGITLALCVLAFSAGWLIARVLKSDRGQRVSLMYGLGMNNNGTGLVLASLALADHPRVMLPLIFYNLVQHLVAGIADSLSQPPETIETRSPLRRQPHRDSRSFATSIGEEGTGIA